MVDTRELAGDGPTPVEPPDGRREGSAAAADIGDALTELPPPSGTETMVESGPPRRSEGRDAAPVRIGRFEVIGRLGEGGMGTVFAARDELLDRRVAVKLIRADGAGSSGSDAGERLLREAQALARLSHPNVVAVYEVGTWRDEVFVAMEHVEGKTLRDWQRNPDLGWRDVLEQYVAAGHGLRAAHEAGLVHRDFKPSNVLVGDDGRVRVLDFGLARARSEPVSKDASTREVGSARGLAVELTATGAVMGTPAYMAPEQHQGRPADERSDQFSFCVALFEGVFGQRPFAGDTLAQLTTNVMSGQVTDAPKWVEAPAWLRVVLARGLSVDPAERHEDMAALLRELDRSPRNRARAAVAGLAVVGIGTGAAVLGGSETALDLGESRARLATALGTTRIVARAAADDRSEAAAQRHWDSYVLARSRRRLEVDATESLALLSRLSPGATHWLPEARALARMAIERGVHRRRGADERLRGLTRLESTGEGARGHDAAGGVWTWAPSGPPTRAVAGPEVAAAAEGGADVGAVEGAVDPAAATTAPVGPAGSRFELVDGSVRVIGRRGPALPRPAADPVRFAVAVDQGDGVLQVDATGAWAVTDLARPHRRETSLDTREVTALAMSPRGDELAVGTSDGAVQVRSLGNVGAKTRIVTRHGSPVRALAWGPALASTASGGGVRIVDPSSAAESTATLAVAQVQAMAWARTGDALAVSACGLAAGCGVALVSAGGQALGTLGGPEAAPVSVWAASKDDILAAEPSEGGTSMWWWHAEEAIGLGGLAGRVLAADVDRDRARVAALEGEALVIHEWRPDGRGDRIFDAEGVEFASGSEATVMWHDGHWLSSVALDSLEDVTATPIEGTVEALAWSSGRARVALTLSPNRGVLLDPRVGARSEHAPLDAPSLLSATATVDSPENRIRVITEPSPAGAVAFLDWLAATTEVDAQLERSGIGPTHPNQGPR